MYLLFALIYTTVYSFLVHVVRCDSVDVVQLIIPRWLPAALFCGMTGSSFKHASQVRQSPWFEHGELAKPGYGKVVLISVSPDDLTQMDSPSIAQRAISIQWAWAGARPDTEKSSALCGK